MRPMRRWTTAATPAAERCGASRRGTQVTKPCTCHWETGECQAPDGCKTVAEVQQLRAALTTLYEWYDRDGSVGGASNAFEDNRAALAAGERK